MESIVTARGQKLSIFETCNQYSTARCIYPKLNTKSWSEIRVHKQCYLLKNVGYITIVFSVCVRVQKKIKKKNTIIRYENDHKRMVKILEMQWLAESPREVLVAMRLKKLNTRKKKRKKAIDSLMKFLKRRKGQSNCFALLDRKVLNTTHAQNVLQEQYMKFVTCIRKFPLLDEDVLVLNQDGWRPLSSLPSYLLDQNVALHHWL